MVFRQVHLDFHTSEKIDGIGAAFDKVQFQEALKRGHVNSITVFSKCHHGYAYHPTKANVMHPGLKFDLLGAQIQAAHEIGVQTPVYLSAGYDERLVRLHPDWRQEVKSHEFDNFTEAKYHVLCMNTPYLEALLAQIREVLENYDADGIFLDIVGVRPCCCNHCLKSMMEQGLDPDDDAQNLAHAEQVYANYLKRVRETVDSIRPGLPVFHNSGHIRQGRRDLIFANSHLEIESLPTGGWGYDHFPVSAKYAENLGLEYLGMTGKFHTTWGEFGGYKHPNALRYEAALSVAMGAKCSIGDQLAPNGRMDPYTYELIGTAFQEVEEKEPWLDGVTPVCDVAVLTLESNRNEAKENLGNDLQKSDMGAGRILLEGKYLFTLLDSQMDFSPYKVIILPDSISLTPETRQKLRRFVAAGGKLLASGTSAIEDGKFLFDFGAEYRGEGVFTPSYARPCLDNPYQTDYIMYTPCQNVATTDGEELVQVINPYFNRTAEHFCSHQHTPSSGIYGGCGMVRGRDGIYISWKIFKDYATKGELICKRLVCMALDRLLGGQKTLCTNLGSNGVVNLLQQKEQNRYVAHLLYAVTSRRGENIDAIEDIVPIYNTRLRFRLPERIRQVYLAPQRKLIPFTQNGVEVTVTVDKVECHQMVVFEYGE